MALLLLTRHINNKDLNLIIIVISTTTTSFISAFEESMLITY
jgi:hypothetical protein